MEEAPTQEEFKGNPSICLEKAIFGWTSSDEESRIVIESITADIEPGELVIVTGPVASGKSSFLLHFSRTAAPVRAVP